MSVTGQVASVNGNASFTFGALSVVGVKLANYSVAFTCDTVSRASQNLTALLQVPSCPANNEPTVTGMDCTRCPTHSVSPDGQRCVCDAGYFDNSTQSRVGGTGSALECVPCVTGMDCSQPGATVTTVSLLPDYWRTSTSSSQVLACLTNGLCMWTWNTTASESSESVTPLQYSPCVPLRGGPLCALCAPGTTSAFSKDNSCRPCTDDFLELTLAGKVGLAVVCIAALLLLANSSPRSIIAAGLALRAGVDNAEQVGDAVRVGIDSGGDSDGEDDGNARVGGELKTVATGLVEEVHSRGNAGATAAKTGEKTSAVTADSESASELRTDAGVRHDLVWPTSAAAGVPQDVERTKPLLTEAARGTKSQSRNDPEWQVVCCCWRRRRYKDVNDTVQPLRLTRIQWHLPSDSESAHWQATQSTLASASASAGGAPTVRVGTTPGLADSEAKPERPSRPGSARHDSDAAPEQVPHVPTNLKPREAKQGEVTIHASFESHLKVLLGTLQLFSTIIGRYSVQVCVPTGPKLHLVVICSSHAFTLTAAD